MNKIYLFLSQFLDTLKAFEIDIHLFALQYVEGSSFHKASLPGRHVVRYRAIAIYNRGQRCLFRFLYVFLPFTRTR